MRCDREGKVAQYCQSVFTKWEMDGEKRPAVLVARGLDLLKVKSDDRGADVWSYQQLVRAWDGEEGLRCVGVAGC
jgi:hypothetical protein